MILELVHTLQDPKSLMRLRHLKKGAAWTDFVLPDVCWYRLIRKGTRAMFVVELLLDVLLLVEVLLEVLVVLIF